MGAGCCVDAMPHWWPGYSPSPLLAAQPHSGASLGSMVPQVLETLGYQVKTSEHLPALVHVC